MRTAALALRDGVRVLTEAGIEQAAGDARRLMAYALGIDLDRLTLALPEPISGAAEAAFEAAILRRKGREPVSHIVGLRMFYGREFRVTGDVLDPRPETEVLIEVALAEPFEDVLDLGTGSGCILLTLLAEMDCARGLGTDVSDAALAIARDNLERMDLGPRARFAAHDWFEGLTGNFDLIVSNPPYIALDELDGLAPDVVNWEPRQALTDGGDGLGAYRAIFAGMGRHLRPGGRIMVEIGPTQADAVAAMAELARLDAIQVLPDLDGRDRVVMARAR